MATENPIRAIGVLNPKKNTYEGLIEMWKEKHSVI